MQIHKLILFRIQIYKLPKTIYFAIQIPAQVNKFQINKIKQIYQINQIKTMGKVRDKGKKREVMKKRVAKMEAVE